MRIRDGEHVSERYHIPATAVMPEFGVASEGVGEWRAGVSCNLEKRFEVGRGSIEGCSLLGVNPGWNKTGV